MKDEKWKDVLGFEEYYQISSRGVVESKDRVMSNFVAKNYILPGKRLVLFPNSNGYLRVELRGLDRKVRVFVHRLVALAFIDNLSNKPEVNHIDSNFLNNTAENLEWVTHKENMYHAIKKGRFKETWRKTTKALKAANTAKMKPVVGTSKTGETIRFLSIQEAGRYFGNGAAGICVCCQGKLKTSQGYAWKYATPQDIARMNENWRVEK